MCGNSFAACVDLNRSTQAAKERLNHRLIVSVNIVYI